MLPTFSSPEASSGFFFLVTLLVTFLAVSLTVGVGDKDLAFLPRVLGGISFEVFAAQANPRSSRRLTTLRPVRESF